jgi:superfamily II DNA/RNA helicase
MPQITALKADEAGGGPAARPGRPRALVLGPTRELTEQLLRVAKSLAHHEKFASACVSGGACQMLLQGSLAWSCSSDVQCWTC